MALLTYSAALIEKLGSSAAARMLEEGIVKRLSAQSVIVHEGQYLDSLPILLDGYAKMIIQKDERSFLLQYIMPINSCIMPYATVSRQIRSRLTVMAEVDVVILYVSSEKLLKWLNEYPLLNDWVHQQYNEYEQRMITIIHQLLFDDLEVRLLHFLKEKARVSKSNRLVIKHKEIAAEIGSVREVVSRTLMKLQKEHKIIQHEHDIELLSF